MYAEDVKHDIVFVRNETRQGNHCQIYRFKGNKERFYFNEDEELVGVETNTYGHFLKGYEQ
jgi:hypothetical protein